MSRGAPVDRRAAPTLQILRHVWGDPNRARAIDEDIDTDSPYMQLVAPVRAERCRRMSRDELTLFGIDQLNVVRSDIPASRGDLLHGTRRMRQPQALRWHAPRSLGGRRPCWRAIDAPLRMVRSQARSGEMARLVCAAARSFGFGVRLEGRGML